MERIFLAYLAIAIMFLWLAGWTTHAAPWLTWSFGILSLVCFVASAVPSRLVTSTVSLLAGVWMLGLWIANLATGRARGLTFFPGALAVLFFILGGVSAWIRYRRADASR